MTKDSLGDRMKKYEYVTRTHLTPRTPAIIRIDGKAFHTFTRGFQKPFDTVLVDAMQGTMKYLCQNIQGCVLGYTQSDEITLVLVDYNRLDTSAWFDYNIQKCASVAASMATMAFNREFARAVHDWRLDYLNTFLDPYGKFPEESVFNKLMDTYEKRMGGAMFDTRVFSIPKEEVCNCILWRQLDAIRNSISMVGQENFSHKELFKKSSADIIEMLLAKGIDWNKYATHLQRGSCCIRKKDSPDARPSWEIDMAIPIFKDKDRKYVDDLVYVGE